MLNYLIFNYGRKSGKMRVPPSKKSWSMFFGTRLSIADGTNIVDYTSEYAWHFSPYKLLSNLNASKVFHCKSENFKQILTSFLCVAANGAIWRKSSRSESKHILVNSCRSLSKTYFNSFLLVYLASLLKSVLK